MDKPILSIIFIVIGIIVILIGGIPSQLSFDTLRDPIIGMLFLIIGARSYIKTRTRKDNNA